MLPNITAGHVLVAPYQPLITPDGKTAVFLANILGDLNYYFYSVPVQGGPPQLLYIWASTYNIETSFSYGGEGPLFTTSPDSKYLLFLADIETHGSIDLYSLEILGVCGNGVVTPDEGCDDGNNVDGDGCSSTCQVESGCTCSGEPSDCVCSGPNPSSAGTASDASRLTSFMQSLLLL